MSVDDTPLKLWAIEVKKKIQKKIPNPSPNQLFEALVAHDNRNVYRYYFEYEIPASPEEKYELDMRLHTLKYIATSLVVN